MSIALKLALAPALPEAEGPRSGCVGGGSEEPLRLLIAGDSSAAGVGVARQDQALAGHLTRNLHALTQRPVHWALHARSGASTRQVHALLRAHVPADDREGGFALVVTGVNDVIELVPPRRALQQREQLADWLLAHAGVRHVVFAPLPPVHRFPLLPQPLRHVMGADARTHDSAMARWAATRRDVSHVPIELDLGVDAMASDGFHPGEPVYRVCGEALAVHIARLIEESSK